MFKKALALGAVALGVTSIAGAAGNSATANFNVTATVISSCSLSATDLAFGNYDPFAALDKTGTTNVTVTCSLLAPYTIALSQGTNGGSVTTRKMLITGGGTDLLNYGLYRDAAHLLNWGETVGTDTLAGVGTGVAVNVPVYGVIPAGQNVSIGSYTDTITVTLNY